MVMLVFVLQLHEHKAILKVQITEWTAAGLVAKIEVNVVILVIFFWFPRNRGCRSVPACLLFYFILLWLCFAQRKTVW